MPRSSNIPPPRVNFSMRCLRLEISQQMKTLALTLNVSQEEIANQALKIGLRMIQKRIAKGEI